MLIRSVPVTVLAVSLAGSLVLVGCTADRAPEPAAAPSPGPLVQSPDHPDGVALPPTDIFGYGVGIADDGTAGVVYADDTQRRSASTRIGLGTDPSTWVVAAPDGVFSYQDVATPAVAADGSLAALAVLRDAERTEAVVLRVAPDGTVTTTPVPGLSFGRYEWSDVDAVSDDGRTAVVVEQVVGSGVPDTLEVTTVDLPTATIAARTVVDVPVVASAAAIGPDGAVSVLVDGSGADDPARLLRFDAALQRGADVLLTDAAAGAVPQFALAPDGTAVVTLVTGDLVADDATTRVLAVPAGETGVTTVAELSGQVAPGARRAGNALLTVVGDWAYLFLRDGSTAATQLVPLDMGSGRLGAPVDTCDSPVPGLLTRSGSGRTAAAVVTCVTADDDGIGRPGGSLLLTLGED